MTTVPEPADPFASIVWDTEPRSAFSEPEGRVRDNDMYLNARLWEIMNEAFPGVTAYVRTATDSTTGEVLCYRAAEKDPGAIKVRLLGALNCAEINIWRVLMKLNLTVPSNRQLNIPVSTREISGRTLIVFHFDQRKSVPRNKKEEGAGA